MNHILTCLSYLICALYSLTVFCINSDAIEKQAMISIDRLYHSQNLPSNASITERINWFSEQFKGRPYVLGSLGEGSKAIYDQFPRYRVDAFDCDTFVNTVLALALSNSFSSFEGCLHHLRYYQGQISYINRNHFMSLDWNQHNQALGILKDITSDIKDANNQPIALVAEALIDKPGWYSYKTIKTIRLQVPNTREQQNRLVALKNKAKHLPVTATKIPYLPLSVLFNKKGEANVDLFSHIPQSAIIQIVRPNWNLKESFELEAPNWNLKFSTSSSVS